MTIKEAILKSLEELNKLTNYSEVYDHIVKNGYYNFRTGKTPKATISGALGNFIRKGDTRVKRIKDANGNYSYYLTKNEQVIGINVLTEITEKPTSKPKSTAQSYHERDLHKLLSSYLKNADIYSKTVFHEQSKPSNDNNQIWTHPDMIGIKFLKLQSTASQNFLKAINREDTFKLSSYEIKKEINSDTDLKKSYFQAVSNSSWANYGYLVAFEISDSLSEEMERLNQSFGIGIMELNANPYESRILFQAKFRELDFKTIDKLCKINPEFEKFIAQTEKLMTAEEKYFRSTEKEFDEFCDDYFKNDSEIEKYCRERHIPFDPEGDEG